MYFMDSAYPTFFLARILSPWGVHLYQHWGQTRFPVSLPYRTQGTIAVPHRGQFNLGILLRTRGGL